MHILNIRRLCPQDEKAFYEAYNEFDLDGDFDLVPHYRVGMSFKELLVIIEDQEKGQNLPEGYVPSTFLFSFIGSKLIARVMIRHQLNDFLRTVGGHVGYGVVPSERRRGYATQMLQASLNEARSLGIERVLVTCDDHNIASRRIIEKAEGEFEGISKQKGELPDKRLYWISTTLA